MSHLPLKDIVVPERLRPVHGDWIEVLAASMDEIGLKEPIVVREVKRGRSKQTELVAGAHRLAAAERLGWEEISVSLVEASDLEARLIEIDENLMRRELSPLDRAIFLNERKKVHEELYPDTKHGGDVKSADFKEKNQVANLATRFSKAAAEKTGLSERSIRRAVAIISRLSPDVIDLVRQTGLAESGKELEALAKKEPAAQKAVLQAIADGQAKKVSEAEVLLSMKQSAAPTSEDEKHYRALLASWNRLGRKPRRRFLEALGLEASEAVLDAKVKD
ncbi:ParB N-terminal domain-containing protein [Pseudovibrio exalbescens]|uniref:ParB/RepB/Spo0J family partition protein n=1 Tax=Pseudovibrio exalbescens TaxID=197461 RepID=UPI0023668F5A|nr:ParB N-terminal domain-containing protein [Pseudovibrio exalbescens]MDD7908533.1 ParB N-terminal domain-containing protein [Pseudovibrio exalbescens]